MNFKKKSLKIILVVFTIVLGFLAFYLLRKIYIMKKSQNLNLILVSVDTLRPDHMGTYGYIKNTTPNIDRWAKDATVFTNAYTVVPVTYPSFIALLGGLSPFSTRISNNRIAEYEKIPPISSNTRTLPKILKENGFITAAFNSNPHISSYYTNIGEGFDEYYLLSTDENKDYDSFIIKTTKYIEKNKNNNKFFLWIHLLNPHWPYRPPREYRCESSKSCDFLKNLNDDEMEVLESRRKKLSGWGADGDATPTKEESELYGNLYDGEIKYADSLIKKVLETIQQTGLDKKSLVVFYGDHGESFDHNYFFAHGAHLYNSSIKIPLIIKAPLGIKRDKINSPIQNTDIFPTILDLLSIPSNAYEIDGKSFASLVYNKEAVSKEKKFIYVVNQDWSKFAVLDGDYKYIFSLQQTCHARCWNNPDREEFYNTRIDPLEKNNLIEKETKQTSFYKTKLFNYLSHYNLPPSGIKSSDLNITEDNFIERLEKLKSLGY